MAFSLGNAQDGVISSELLNAEELGERRVKGQGTEGGGGGGKEGEDATEGAGE